MSLVEHMSSLPCLNIYMSIKILQTPMRIELIKMYVLYQVRRLLSNMKNHLKEDKHLWVQFSLVFVKF
jgi:hypothetical protein